MTIKIEDFSLLNFIGQFREFNFAVRANRARLTPYFWWAHTNKLAQMNFILSGLIAEKIAAHTHDLPYNKKFIIRENSTQIEGTTFAGVIGLDRFTSNSARTEIWAFITQEHAGHHVASGALKLAEEYARSKFVKKIFARTSNTNLTASELLQHNNYRQTGLQSIDRIGNTVLIWEKSLTDKSY